MKLCQVVENNVCPVIVTHRTRKQRDYVAIHIFFQQSKVTHLKNNE